MSHKGVSFRFLILYHEHNENILDQVITGNKISVHYYIPPTKQMSNHWMKKSECTKVKVKPERSVNKCMVTVFRGRKGIFLTHYMPRGTTINADIYRQVLRASVTRPMCRDLAETALTAVKIHFVSAWPRSCPLFWTLLNSWENLESLILSLEEFKNYRCHTSFKLVTFFSFSP